MDMNTRVSKKILTPFDNCNATAAVLMVNLFDPQIATTKLFLQAIQQTNLQFLVVGNSQAKQQ